MDYKQYKKYTDGYQCCNALLKSPIISIVERGKFIFVTLLNKEKRITKEIDET